MQWLVVKMRKITISCAVITELVFLHSVLLVIARNFEQYEKEVFGWLLTTLWNVNIGFSTTSGQRCLQPCLHFQQQS